MGKVVSLTRHKVRVLGSLKDFESAFSKRCDDAREFFEGQDQELHAKLDMELTTRIDQYYRDLLGDWESGGVWWHNMDFYGDGVRALRFVLGSFPPDSMPIIAGYLAGKFNGFSVLVWFWKDEIEEGQPVGGLWLSSKEWLVSRALLKPLNIEVG